MRRLLIRALSRSEYPDVTGFSSGLVAKISGTNTITLGDINRPVCAVRWHELYIGGMQVHFRFVSSAEFTQAYSDGIQVVYLRRWCKLTRYHGYINGRRCFIARPVGIFSRKLKFCTFDRLDEMTGPGYTDAMALLCWWMTYRD